MSYLHSWICASYIFYGLESCTVMDDMVKMHRSNKLLKLNTTQYKSLLCPRFKILNHTKVSIYGRNDMVSVPYRPIPVEFQYLFKYKYIN